MAEEGEIDFSCVWVIRSCVSWWRNRRCHPDRDSVGKKKKKNVVLVRWWQSAEFQWRVISKSLCGHTNYNPAFPCLPFISDVRAETDISEEINPTLIFSITVLLKNLLHGIGEDAERSISVTWYYKLEKSVKLYVLVFALKCVISSFIFCLFLHSQIKKGQILYIWF